MKIFLIFLVLVIGCGKDKDSAEPCSPTKNLSSVWTLRGENVVFDFRDCDTEMYCYITTDGTCDDGPGEMLVGFTNDGRMAIANCSDTQILDTGNWSIGCDNILRITNYNSGDPDDIFE